MYGGQCHGPFAISCIQLQQLCDAKGIDLQFNFLFGESLITRGRNRLAHEFMQSDCTHLFFCDADIQFKAEDVIRLLDADKDCIAGAYNLKKISWGNVRNAILAKPDISEADLQKLTGNFVLSFKDQSFAINKPVEVIEVGTGCLLIRREVFETLMPTLMPFKERHTQSGREELVYGYFDTGLSDTGYFLSEDYKFCDIYRKAGGQIWLLPDIELVHIGSYNYAGSIPAMARFESTR